MKITRDNYEAFFLDYLDGSLEEKDMDQFLDFLEQHADLKEELRSLETIHLPETSVSMPQKQNLYRTREEEKAAVDNKLVAYLENDLDDDDRKKFEAYLAVRPELQKELTVLMHTRLKPDLAVQFANKKKLYRKPASVLFITWSARAAAVIVLAWGISLFFRSQQSAKTILSTPELAQVSPKTSSSGKVATSNVPPATLSIQGQKRGEIAARAQKKKPVVAKIISETPSKPVLEPVPAKRDLIAMTEIEPRSAQLPEEQPEIRLAVARVQEVQSTPEPIREMEVSQFLAERARNIGNEGVRSFQRLARLGLGLASEISGDRITYNEKDGKISSVEFESKLLAFTIPLEKK